LDEALADHSGRAQNPDGKFCFDSHKHSSVQEDGLAQGKKPLLKPMAGNSNAGIAFGHDLASAAKLQSAIESSEFNEKNLISLQADGKLSRSFSSPIRTKQERFG
jgi:hypothetical protein